MSTALSIWQAGAEIAAQLDRGVLFTELARDIAGEEIITGITGRLNGSAMTQREHGLLETWRDGTVTCYRRTGTLRTASGRDIARVKALFLPLRIPDHDTRRLLWTTGIPLGRALIHLGVRREPLGTETICAGDIAVRASGLLVLPDSGTGLPVALAEEEVLREFASIPDRRG